jgi:menaquinone-dependent protoporphyrinogen IX oxidase
MAKAIVIYESRWGNTKLIAEKIAEGMKHIAATEVVVTDVKTLETDKLANYDAIVIGSPNHMGAATRNISNLVDKLAGLQLDGKIMAVFDTCLKSDHEKVVKKLERMITQKVPGIKLITPGLSIVVNGMKGPAIQSELARSIEFGKIIARQFKK